MIALAPEPESDPVGDEVAFIDSRDDGETPRRDPRRRDVKG